MGEVYPCPLCGRASNRKGRPFDEPENTVSHITGAHDETHRDERGEEYRQEIENNAVPKEDMEVDLVDPSKEDDGQSDGFMPDVSTDVSREYLNKQSQPLDEAVKSNAGVIYGNVRDINVLVNRVESLEEELQRHHEVVAELSELVELLAGAVSAIDHDTLRNVEEARKHGERVNPWDWESDVAGVQRERFEPGDMQR